MHLLLLLLLALQQSKQCMLHSCAMQCMRYACIAHAKCLEIVSCFGVIALKSDLPCAGEG